MVLISAKNIVKDYRSKNSDQILRVLDDVSLTIPEYSITGITGSSGCGKSTLLHILGGLDKPTSGEIFFRNTNIHTFSENKLAEFRNQNIGFIFQFHYLLPEFTAHENVMMPALIGSKSHKEISNQASELLIELGLENRLNHRPSELSGGEQQRVAIARSMINNPDIILADEPTGNLDEFNTQHVIDVLFELTKSKKKGLILVTHDKSIGKKCDIQLELKNKTLHTAYL